MQFALLLLAGLALRLGLTLTHDGYLGVDGGAYLLSVNAVLGDEPTGAGFPRPPLAPGWLLVPFTELLGVDVGYKVWASITSVLPAIPVYLLARRILPEGQGLSSTAPALFAVGFLFVDLLHAEMIVTGALPLAGFALLGMVWWAIGSLAERWSWRNAAILAGCLGLIPWINQTTAGLAIVTIPVYLAALLWFNRRVVHTTTSLAQITPPLVLGGVIALAALPWYLKVLPVTGLLNYPGRMVYLHTFTDVAWLQFILAWGLAIWLIRGNSEPWLRSLGLLCGLLGTLLIFLSTDETLINVFYRSSYLLPLPVYVGVAALVFRRLIPAVRSTRLPAAGIAIAAGVMLVGFVWQFGNQAGYSDMLTDDSVEALQIAAVEAPGKAVINNSFTLALWISALNKVESPHTWTWPPPPTWTETDQYVRCVLGWVDGCDVDKAVVHLNAEYILIESRFPYYNSRAPGVYGAPDIAEPWDNLPTVPWLTQRFQQGSTTLYRINP